MGKLLFLQNRTSVGPQTSVSIRVCPFWSSKKNRLLYQSLFNWGGPMKFENTFLQIITFCRKTIISPQLNIRLISDQSLKSSSFFLVSRRKQECSICHGLLPHFSNKTMFVNLQQNYQFFKEISGNEFNS